MIYISSFCKQCIVMCLKIFWVSKTVFSIIRYTLYPHTVVIWCIIMGADDDGSTAVLGHRSVWDVNLSERRLSDSTATKLSGSAVSILFVLLCFLLARQLVAARMEEVLTIIKSLESWACVNVWPVEMGKILSWYKCIKCVAQSDSWKFKLIQLPGSLWLC